MPVSYKDMIYVTTESVGIDALEQSGSIVGYSALSAEDDGKTFHIMIQDVDENGLPNGHYEVCESVYTHDDVTPSWSRGALIASSTGNRINFVEGDKRIAVVLSSDDIEDITAGIAGAVPGGADRQLQYNNNGAFGGASAIFTVDGNISNTGGWDRGERFGYGATVVYYGGTAIGNSASAGGNCTAIGNGAYAPGGGSIAIGFETKVTGPNQLVIGCSATELTDWGINDVYIGNGVACTAPQNLKINATGGSGVNVAGAILRLAPGKSTGNATPSSVILQSTVAGVSGSNPQTLSDTLVVTDGRLQLPGSRGPTTMAEIYCDISPIDQYYDSLRLVGVSSAGRIRLGSPTKKATLTLTDTDYLEDCPQIYFRDGLSLGVLGARSIGAFGETIVYSASNGQHEWYTGTAGYSNPGAGGNLLRMRLDGTGNLTLFTGLLNAKDGSGVNVPGNTLRLAPGRSTGNATPASVVIQSTVPGVSSSNPQTLQDTLTVTNGKLLTSEQIAIGPTSGPPNAGTNTYSIAIGYGTSATGQNTSIAIGYGANNVGMDAMAIGREASVAGETGIALGTHASSSGGHGISIGPYSNANNESTIALGLYTYAGGLGSVAIGRGAHSEYGTIFSINATVGVNAATILAIQGIPDTLRDGFFARDMVYLRTEWVDTVTATRKARLKIEAADFAGSREAIRVESNGAAALISFFGAAAVLQPTAIADADGTLADLTTKFNALLAKLRALGLLAP